MKTLASGTIFISTLTTISRVFGYIRDAVIAAIFGASYYSDVFFTAFLFPNLLRSFLAEGALTSAFVPSFSQKITKSKNEAQILLKSTYSLFLIITIIVSILGILFAPTIINLFAPGFIIDSRKFDLTVTLTRIMFPFVIFVCLVAISDGAASSGKSFGASASAQIAMNCTFIAAALSAGMFNIETGIYVLSWGVLLGGIVQIFACLPFLKKIGLKFGFNSKIITNDTKAIIWLMLPAILGASTYQLKILVTRVLASYLPTGSISQLFYAERIFQLPIGIFSISLASVLLPLLARDFSNNDQNNFSKRLFDSLRFSNFVLIPISFWLYIFSDDIIRILFERNNFKPEDTIKTALALQAFTLGIWSYSATSILMRAFLAKKDTITPSLIGIITLIVHIIFSLQLIGPIAANYNLSSYLNFLRSLIGYNFDFGAYGLALAGSLSSAITLIITWIWLERKFLGITKFKQCLISFLKCFVASSTCLIFSDFGFVIGTCFSIISYLFLLFILKSQELKETFLAFSRYRK